MARHFRIDFPSNVPSIRPPVGTLLGGKRAARSRVEAVCRAQDRVPALGRRVVMSLGLSGSQSFQVPNTDPDIPGNSTPPTRTHPPPNLARRVGLARFDLTPGSFLRMSALALPSGATQDQVTYISVSTLHRFDPAGNFGRLRLAVTWTDRAGASVQTTHELDLAASDLQYGAYEVDGDAWRTLRLARTGLLMPGDLGDPEQLARWCRHVHVTAELYFIGGVRPIDVVVHEEPSAFAMEADDDPGYWVSHAYAPTLEANGPALHQPVEALDQAVSDGDPRGGTHHLLDVHHAQWDRLGPALINWHAYAEGTSRYGSYTGTQGSNGDDTSYSEAYQWANSTSLLRFPDNAAVGYDATNGPGWSIASAAYSRRLSENEPASMATNGSIPVIVRVRAGSSSAGTNGLLRVQASAYSYVDVVLSNLQTTPGWYVAYGHLRCGRGPGDPSVLQAFYQRLATGSGGSVRIYNVQVYRAGSWAPASI